MAWLCTDAQLNPQRVPSPRPTYFQCPSCGNKKHFHSEEISNGWECPPDHVLGCSACDSWEDPIEITYSNWSGNWVKSRFRRG
jgi:transcription elongation factor Elf1